MGAGKLTDPRTGGLSAWIGYTDLDQDTHYKWSDNTQVPVELARWTLHMSNF